MRILLVVVGFLTGFSGQARAIENLQALLDQAVTDGRSDLTLPAGTYRLEQPNSKKAHLTLKGAKDLKIHAEGVKLICTGNGTALALEDCRNVTLDGLSIDYDPLPFTQGVITRVSLSPPLVEVQIDAGYPVETHELCNVYDRDTRRLKADTHPVWIERGEVTGKDRVSLQVRSAEMLANVSEGDLLLIGSRGGKPPHGLTISNSGGLTLENLTLYTAPVFGILELGGDGGNIYRGIRITPGPPPPGATAPRLRSCIADGIHFCDVRKGPLVENCLIENMGDDAIAIQGSYHLIFSGGEKTWTVVSKRDLIMEPGDLVEILSPAGVVRGRARVASVRPVTDLAENTVADFVEKTIWKLQRPLYTKVWTVEIDTALAAQSGDRLGNLDRCGSGFVVRNNTIRNNRARGILTKASDALIEGNTIDGSTVGGIVLAPEFTWNESATSRNVIVRNNVIKNVGRDTANPGFGSAGGIVVCLPVAGNTYAPAGAHENITIEGNRFENNRGVNLLLTSGSRFIVRNNIFTRTHRDAATHGGDYGVNGGAVIWAAEMDGVRLEGNQFSDLGPGFQTRLDASRNVKNLINHDAP